MACIGRLTTHEVVQFYVGKRLRHIVLSESRPVGNENSLKQYSNINIQTLLQYTARLLIMIKYYYLLAYQ